MNLPTMNGAAVIARTPQAIYLRIPRDLSLPCGSCACEYCKSHPLIPPHWDTLCVPIDPAFEYANTVHMPDAKPMIERYGVRRIRATYRKMREVLMNGLHDMRILAGEIVGPSDASWQDVAGTAETNFEVLARQLHEARTGNAESSITFPSPGECLEGDDNA